MGWVPIEWTSLSSIVRGKALIGYLPRVCDIPRVVDDMEVSGSRGSSVLPLQSVNYSNSRVHGQGQLGGAA